MGNIKLVIVRQLDNKTLIAYDTRYGATEEVAAVIQKILEKKFNIDVEIFRLKPGRVRPDLNKYDNIVIGSGIKYGKWCSEVLDFLNKDFSDKKVAVYICSGYAGEEDLYDQAYNNFLKAVVDEHNLNPVKMEAFGGRVPMTQIPGLYIMRILRRLPEFQIDGRDWDKIENWAENLGQLFIEETEEE